MAPSPDRLSPRLATSPGDLREEVESEEASEDRLPQGLCEVIDKLLRDRAAAEARGQAADLAGEALCLNFSDLPEDGPDSPASGSPAEPLSPGSGPSLWRERCVLSVDTPHDLDWEGLGAKPALLPRSRRPWLMPRLRTSRSDLSSLSGMTPEEAAVATELESPTSGLQGRRAREPLAINVVLASGRKLLLSRSRSNLSAESPKSWRAAEERGPESPGSGPESPGLLSASEKRSLFYRRSESAGSKLSSGTSGSAGASTWTSDQSSTSDPTHITIGELRERNCIHVNAEALAQELFEFVEPFGRGTFGEVWRGCRKACQEEKYAIKRVSTGASRKELRRLERELAIFERLSCPHIVKLHEVILERDFLYLVMDLCTGGNLQAYMDSYVDEPQRLRHKLEFPDEVIGLPTKLVGKFMWQMLAGIAYMHHFFFAHRDIKLKNYMIKAPSEEPSLQLVDFGMATRFHKGSYLYGTVGTVKYMAPEVLKGRYTEKCDIWAIGVACYILCTEQCPWDAEQVSTGLPECILANFRAAWPRCDKPGSTIALIDKMLCYDPEARPSAKALLKQSRWLRSHSRLEEDKPQSCCSIA